MIQEQEKMMVFFPLIQVDGAIVPGKLCSNRHTALRLANAIGAPLMQDVAYRIDDKWYGPAVIFTPTDEDLTAEAVYTARQAAIARAREAGVSEEDIAAMTVGMP